MQSELYHFHTIAGLPINDQSSYSARLKVVTEEIFEFMEEAQRMREAIHLNRLEEGPHADLLKELVDVVYTLVSLCVGVGYDFDKAFLLVHRDNKAKVEQGSVNAEGKLQKPEGWPKLSVLECVPESLLQEDRE